MDLSESRNLLEPVTNSIETQPSILSDTITVREQVRECFKPRYRPRSVKNKGAIMVIVWCHLTMSLYTFLVYFASSTYSKPVYTALIIAIGLTIPFAGWLADVHFGRYKIISSSIWTMWISAMLLTTGQMALQLLGVSNKVYFLTIFVIPLTIGFVAFQANIIQFGVDQLYDASSIEIKAFIVWLTWGILSSRWIVDTILLYASDNFKILAPLLLCLNLTVAVSLNLVFTKFNVFIVEPVTINPFKLVYGVIKYAVKNKRPRLRSAFTFCEDEKPSRIDFGKRKYGGPFTTEQVEDVKTLFRIIIVYLIMSAFFSTFQDFGGSVRMIFIKQVTRSPSYIYSNFYAIALLVLILLNEVFVYPLFYRCLPNLNALRKFFIGGTLRFVYYGTLLALFTYARYKFIHNTNENGTLTNATLPCIFHGHPNFLSETLDYKWTILVEILLAVSCVRSVLAGWWHRILLFTGTILYERPSTWQCLWNGIHLCWTISVVGNTFQHKECNLGSRDTQL